MRPPLGPLAGRLAHLPLELLVGELEHPAVGVVDQRDLLGAEQVLRDRERADRVVRDDAAGVADDMGIAGLEPERVARIEPRVHARENRELPAGPRMSAARPAPIATASGTGRSRIASTSSGAKLIRPRLCGSSWCSRWARADTRSTRRPRNLKGRRCSRCTWIAHSPNGYTTSMK